MAKQVLQTLSILIQNIRSTTAIFYLFSNNVVNEIVAMRFDFEDDEVLGYFINLLKTISLKFNASTVQFFFQDDGERSSFPLYTEAVKFINHRYMSVSVRSTVAGFHLPVSLRGRVLCAFNARLRLSCFTVCQACLYAAGLGLTRAEAHECLLAPQSVASSPHGQVIKTPI